ncbi:hypothetical protein N7491_006372 [Penicillium cf. griseofulvum]|uniref:Uncharacterized protein n=1 Tax=Penicillium cf. griseofulvum TaxID=2972120 RepID=A0A9W9IZN9_9EURO|nr:hypothetical protein N7472_010600 [Penicillium cf. griseofulvum]KAJ5429356.1 hypothetical protein N7491_006372 [Penicillium cf. griseofulvum]KAJ5436865.1 hypothetical protein N7445_007750 [Penicillium cf. griseofulvum]
MNEITPLSSIVRSFEKIPTELAHQIIDDLRVWDVLKLLCYDNDRVDECISSHPISRVIIGVDLHTISTVRFAVKFYREFLSKLGKRLVEEDSILAKDIYSARLLRRYQVLDHVHSRIYWEIREHWEKLDLTRFGASNLISFKEWPDPQSRSNPSSRYSFQKMKDYWEEIQRAKATLFSQMASELRWGADILEANPDILKRTLDPAQEIRSNTAHIVSRMRRDAAKIVRSPNGKFVPSEHFGYVFVQVIPFDSALTEILSLMQSQGIVVENQVVTDGLPPSVTKLAHIVVCGMSRFYRSPLEIRNELSKKKLGSTANVEGEILRTGNTAWSEQLKTPLSIDGAFFTPFKTGIVRDFIRPHSCNWEPHSEMEKEWLESFVQLHRYLKGLGK